MRLEPTGSTAADDRRPKGGAARSGGAAHQKPTSGLHLSARAFRSAADSIETAPARQTDCGAPIGAGANERAAAEMESIVIL